MRLKLLRIALFFTRKTQECRLNCYYWLKVNDSGDLNGVLWIAETRVKVVLN